MPLRKGRSQKQCRWPVPKAETTPAGSRLAKRPTDQFPDLVEYQDVGGKRIVGGELTARPGSFVIAHARQAVPGFEDEHLEPAGVAEKGDTGRSIETSGKYRRREPWGQIDRRRQSRIKEGGVVHTVRGSRGVGHDLRLGDG